MARPPRDRRRAAARCRSAGLEPPFVGRERELSLVKQLFHATAQRSARAPRARSPASAASANRGSPGSSSSTSTGSETTTWWHRGRCLAYGEGVAYWALAEIVRMRCADPRGRGPATRRPRSSRDCLELARSRMPEERASIGPRLAHLLGLERARGHRPQDLFPAWRLFFERLADNSPMRARVRGSAVGRPGAARRSSSTCSSGRVARRCTCSRSRGRSSPSTIPTSAGPSANSTTPRPRTALRRGDMTRASRRATSPGCRSIWRGRSLDAGARVCRCTRSRRCECCSTAACSPATAPCTGPTGDHRHARDPGHAPRACRRAA